MRTAALLILFFVTADLAAQPSLGLGTGNYCGLLQAGVNPAHGADNRLRVDVVLAGLEAGYNNSWFAVRRPALRYEGRLLSPSTIRFPDSWQNQTPGVDNNIFKNFHFYQANGDRALVLSARILLPSVMVQLNNKHSVAFTWNVRQFINVSGIGPQLANIFEKELDFSVTQNSNISNAGFAAIQMSWAEYGFSYARVLRDRRKHFLKGGITVKILQGLESVYFVSRKLDFLFSTRDSSSYFNTDFSFGRSPNVNADPLRSGTPLRSFYHYVTSPAPGLDIGFVYEWRPDHEKFRYKKDGRKFIWRNDLNKYKLRAGASLTDLGRILFRKDGNYYDLDVKITGSNISRYTDLKGAAKLDSVIRHDFGNGDQSATFGIMLPANLNLQADYSFNQLFYLEARWQYSNLFSSTLMKVRNYSWFALAPRIEHYWFNFSVPFTYDALRASRGKPVTVGLNMRAGPLTFGSADLSPFFSGDISAFNIYAVLRAAIPYPRLTDRDRDGIRDKDDLCPDDAGPADTRGCPDADKDLVADREDACPHQPGLPQFRGCPDTDADGISDALDRCPRDKGLPELKGCPDRDGDLIADIDDACPETKGPAKFRGCPDRDNDNIPDKDDLCPDAMGTLRYRGCPDTDGDLLHDGVDSCRYERGPSENKGCPWPDTDKDGIPDRQDSCVTEPGVPGLHGCPEPPELTKREQRIIEKAYSNLEFATGKDVIRKRSLPYLDALARLLVAHSEEWKIVLSGHTDNEGTAESNLLLSEKRVKAVQRYLMRKGVTGENIETFWYGHSKPLESNETAAGRQRNRRVEMTVRIRSQQ